MKKEIIDDVNDIIFVLKTDGTIAFVNRITEIKLGFDQKELIGKKFSDLVIPKFKQVWQGKLKGLLSGKEVLPYEVELFTKVDKKVRLEIDAKIKKEDGTVKSVIGIARDITERGGRFAEIARKEELFEDILNSSPLAIYSLDRGYTIRSWNPAMEGLTGVKSQDAIGRNWERHLSYLRDYGFDEMMEKVMRTGEPVEREGLLVEFPKKTRRLLDVKIMCSTDGGAVIILEDISEMKKLEQDVKRYNEELSALNQIVEAVNKSLDLSETLNDALDGVLAISKAEMGIIFILDKEKKELVLKVHRGMSKHYINKFQKLKLGEHVAGQAGLCISPITISDSLKDDRATPEVVKSEKYRSLICIPMKYGDEMVGVIEILSRTPNYFKEEDVKFLSSVAEHITMAIENARLYTQTKELTVSLEERIRERVEALRESEEKYRYIFESAEVGIFTLDRDGLFLDSNPYVERLTGFSKEYIMGKKFEKLFPERSFSDALEILNKTLEGGAIFNRELKIRGIDRRAIQMELSMSPIVKDDMIIGAQGIMRDISERKRLMNRIQESHQKLQEAFIELQDIERMKEELITNISHELKTPITVINSSIELIIDELQDESHEILLKGKDSLDRLSNLVTDLIEIAKSGEKPVIYEYKPVRIEGVIDEVLFKTKSLANKKQVVLGAPSRDDLPLVMGDRQKILEVLLHLVKNGIKFNQRGGKVKVDARPKGNYVEVSVIDTGIGIEEKYYDKIFQKFFQIDSTIDRRYSGTGIGLAVVKDIIKTHGGRIWVESKEGIGSKFTFTLPIEKKE